MDIDKGAPSFVLLGLSQIVIIVLFVGVTIPGTYHNCYRSALTE